MPWKLSAWQQWPFPCAHSITRFQDTNGGVKFATHLRYLEQASLDVVADIFSGSICYTCRHIHMQIEDLLEMIAHLRVFKLPTFKMRGLALRLDFVGMLILMSHTRSWCCRATSLPGITFTSVTSLCMVLQKRIKSICMADFPTCMWWDGCHISWNMCSQEAGQMLGHTLGSFLPQDLVQVCHIPSHHALPFTQCMACNAFTQCLHGCSNLCRRSRIQILGSWQSQHTAGQRTGP